MSNGVFNFNFLALLLSEILGGSQIYTRGPYAPWTPPSGEIFFTQSEYFTMSNCVFNFNILPLVLFGILGGSQIYIRGPCAPRMPLSVNILTCAQVLVYIYINVKKTSSLKQFVRAIDLVVIIHLKLQKINLIRLW